MDKILKEHFDNFRKKGILPPELEKLNGSMKLFDDEELLKEWRSNFKGIKWTDDKGNLFRGAVDNLLVHNGKLVVLDYKTRGYPLKDDTAGHYQDQLDIYNLLLRKNNYNTENFAFLLFYHPTKVNENGDVVFHTDLVKMKVSVENAEKIFRGALNTLQAPIPECSDDCGFCHWVSQNKTKIEE